MNQPPLNNPGARYWDDLVEGFDFSPDEKREIQQGADHMIAEVRARRLAFGIIGLIAVFAAIFLVVFKGVTL